MAKAAGQVTLRGRFPVGAVVTLTKVDGPHVLRPEGGEDIETQTVTEEKDAPGVGYVRFSKGVEPGARYFIHGLADGVPINVRITGRTDDDPSEVFEQPPILPDRTRFSDGSFVGDKPTKESAPNILAGNADIRHVSKGTVLRSDTPRGEAHPLDPDERAPKRTQEDVKEGTVQMSDTRPREVDGVQVGAGGEATELVLGPQRQEDVPKSVVQRSSTPTGVATPIPAGDAVEQALDRESSFAKETRGEPVRAAAEPVAIKGGKLGSPTGSTQKASEERDAELKQSERDAALAPAALDQPGDDMLETTGHDAQGQPVAEDVARAAGVEPADKPRDGDASKRADRGKDKARSEAAKKAAATRKRNERKAAKEQDSSKSGTRTGAATTSNTTAKEK